MTAQAKSEIQMGCTQSTFQERRDIGARKSNISCETGTAWFLQGFRRAC
jgi:hypothetical protein